MNAPQLPITITVGATSVVCPTISDTLGVVRGLCEPIRPQADTLVASRLKLGAALNQVREQIPHGSWEPYLERCAAELRVNKHTLRNAVKLAEKIATPKGDLDRDKLQALTVARGGFTSAAGTDSTLIDSLAAIPTAENPSNLHHGVDLSLRKAELLAGIRSAPKPAASSKSDTSAYDDEPDPGEPDASGSDLDDDGFDEETGDFTPDFPSAADPDDEPDLDESPLGDDDDDNDDVSLRERGGLRGLGGGSDHPAAAPAEMLEGTAEVVGADERAGRGGFHALGHGADAEHVLGRGEWRVGDQGRLFDGDAEAVRTALGRVERSALRNGTADAELARRVRQATDRYVAELELIASGSPALNAV